MTVQTYYRYSLLLPLVVPLVVWPLLVTLEYGGIPYLLLALFLLRWMRGKTSEQIGRVTILAPLLMLPIFWLFYVIDALTLKVACHNWKDLALICGIGTAYILLLGYIYVLVVRWVLSLLRS